jgi:hypothetical protein
MRFAMLSAIRALLASQQGDAVLLILGLIFVPVGLLLLWAAATDPGGWVTAWYEGNKDFNFLGFHYYVSPLQVRAFAGLMGACAVVSGAAALAVYV